MLVELRLDFENITCIDYNAVHKCIEPNGAVRIEKEEWKLELTGKIYVLCEIYSIGYQCGVLYDSWERL